ncbi:MAG: formate dehydrogenase accessory sulfurtransferase FdhD [Candidatus Methanofastidiosa archaeon]|nr:formate dehydrogenase accessory sulfurtransferase FdhD [Candidatus Methanofastidiosa archaeon]
MLKDIRAKQHKGFDCTSVDEVVAVESPFTIRCMGYEFRGFATPIELKELCIGHLATQGIIGRMEDIGKLDVIVEDNGFTLWASINAHPFVLKGGMGISLDPDDIYKMNDYVRENAELFDKSGALHYAYVFDTKGNIQCNAYDIGRMNAIDKVVGKCLQMRLDLNDKIIYTTGRIATRTVEKAIRAHIPAIISKAPPMYEAIELAKERGITLIGFSRGRRYNDYTG